MDLSTLVKMSNTYGSNPAYVLAGGGNTSVKDDTTLYVKGSGTQLATIKAEEFVKMDRARLNEIMKTEYPADDVKRESAYLADVMAAVTDDDKTKRPSVEALLHNLFAYTYVLHVHPTLVNGLTCGKGAQTLCEQLLGKDVLWIDICKPGLIKYSDEMFENLINYYKNTNEPTVILLTGDHQPRINDESMDSITNGEWRNWNDEEMMRRYEVPFLIWANYDIDKKIVEKTSMNYLQTILMETIDGDLTGFQKFQQDIQKEIPVLTSNGYWGADGKFYSVDDKNSPYYDLIQEYAMLQYNDMMDYKNRVEDFFELKQ